MNKEEILNKYIDLIDKGYCCACNELNCIDNYPHAKITHSIRELQQENQSLEKENKILRENAEHNDKVVDKAIKFIEDTYYSKNTTDIDSIVLSSDKLIKVKEILKEVK